jgi:probable F420-dependent oxidoreductase
LKFGVCIPNYGVTLAVGSLKRIAQEAERLGFDSIWTTDHVLMQANSGTPYDTITESMTTLAYLAGMTGKVRLGISSLIVAIRNPLVAAKQLATVDFLSSGRVMLAVGTGWNEKEFTFVGSNFHNRGKRVDESIKMFRALWAGEQDNFRGSLTGVKFDNSVFAPRPSGPLTIWIGGSSKSAMKRAATLGDAWHPNVTPLETFRKSVEEFRQVGPEATNKPICVRIGLNTRAPHAEYKGPQGDKRIMLSGNMNENRRILADLESLGVTNALVATNPDGKTAEDQQIASLNEFAKEFL